jgi:hypothetical protein
MPTSTKLPEFFNMVYTQLATFPQEERGLVVRELLGFAVGILAAHGISREQISAAVENAVRAVEQARGQPRVTEPTVEDMVRVIRNFESEHRKALEEISAKK